MDPQLIKLAIQNNIVILKLPPHLLFAPTIVEVQNTLGTKVLHDNLYLQIFNFEVTALVALA